MKFWRKDKLAVIFGVLTLILLYWHSVAMADNTGLTAAGTSTNESSPTTSWSNTGTPGNIASSDDNDVSYGGTSADSLYVTNFGFSIAAGATITAFIVESESSGSASQAVRRRLHYALTTDGTTQVTGTDDVAFNHDQTTDNVVTLSGSTDSLWGTGTEITVSEINSSTFGVIVHKSAAQAGTVDLDRVRINIHFTTAGGLLDRRSRLLRGGQ